MRAIFSTFGLSSLAILAFAGNSLLARAALADGAIEAGAYSVIRLASGALLLLPLLGRKPSVKDAPGAAALAIYVGGFSLAYLSLGAAMGALILFACVQATIMLVGVFRSEPVTRAAWFGLVVAMGGLILLLAPETGGATQASGASVGAAGQAVPLTAAALMALAGIAWGAYTLIGRDHKDATSASARYFMLASVLVLPMLALDSSKPSIYGALLAVISGTITSALGYVIWYKVTPRLGLATVAAVQLATPLVAGIGGVSVLGEPFGWRLAAGGVLILIGLGLTLRRPAAK